MQSFLLSLLRPFSYIIHQLKVWFRNLRLHWKIRLLIITILAITSCISLILFKYSISIYDQQLYKNSADILTLSMQNIESEMYHLITTVSQLSTDSGLQETIRQIETSSSEYDEYKERQELMKHIYISLNKKKYILSVNYIDSDLNINSVGSDTSVLLGSKVQKLYSLAFSDNGAPVWVNPGDDDPALILLCPIREVDNLSLRPMGVIALRMDISKLVKYTLEINSDSNENFYIYDIDNELYHYGNLQETFQYKALTNNTLHSIVGYNTNSYFIVKKDSNYSSWSYYYAIPYNNIFSVFVRLRNTGIIVFICLYLILLVITTYFSNSLTKPLVQLSKKMNHISEFDFKKSTLSFSQTSRTDEIGQLQDCFQNMIRQIEILIQKDYVKQIRIKDNEYRTLQAQINPHFLYNTLDQIYWTALNHKENDIAIMIYSLSRLLRETIKGSSNFDKLISLQDEINLLEYYLTIQKNRFRDRLTFEKSITETALNSYVPKFILQPLVENSIKYGVEATTLPCNITLTAKTDESHLIITIVDNGIGVPEDLNIRIEKGEVQSKGSGIGLSNVYHRLKILYDKQATFTICNQHPQGACATISVPLNTNKVYLSSEDF